MPAFVAVLGNEAARPSPAEAQVRLESVQAAAGANSDSNFPTLVMGPCGSGIAHEDLAAFRRRSMDREAPRISHYQVNEQLGVVCFSRLKRTMADTAVLTDMGFSQDNTDPNAPPPTDAHLVYGYLSKIIAKQRWQKTGNAIGALRALKLGGGLGGGMGSPKSGGEGMSPPAPGPAVRQKRISITTLAAPGGQVDTIKQKNQAALPKMVDLVEMLKKLKGNFAYTVINTKDNWAFAARGKDSNAALYWAVLADGSVTFSNDLQCFPEGADASEFPQNAVWIGRVATIPGREPAANDIDTMEAHPQLKPPSGKASFCREGSIETPAGMPAPIAI